MNEREAMANGLADKLVNGVGISLTKLAHQMAENHRFELDTADLFAIGNSLAEILHQFGSVGNEALDFGEQQSLLNKERGKKAELN